MQGNGRRTFSCVCAPTLARSPVKQGGAVMPTAHYGRDGKAAMCRGRREPRTHQHPRNSTVPHRTSHNGSHQQALELQRPLQTRRSEGTSAQGGRGWAGSNFTRLPRPVSSWRATALAWTAPPLGSPHPYPTICRLWVACSSVGGQVARRLPGRHSSVTASPLRCRTGLSVGRRGTGRPPPLVPSRWSFARRHSLDTLADWWGLQRHCGGIGGRGLFAPQLTYPGSSWEQGSHLPYTPTGRLR